MPSVTEPRSKRSGIEMSKDGSAYIPSSTRADGSTRKEIRVRPGYRPPEDVETYKNRSAAAWKDRGRGGVPGAENLGQTSDIFEVKNKNARRRAAARKLVEADTTSTDDLANALEGHSMTVKDDLPTDLPEADIQNPATTDEEALRQKKIRNQLKKLKAVGELKEKKAAGEKLSPDQLVKLGKETEILRDLEKLDHTGTELNGELRTEQNGESTQNTDEVKTG